MSVREAAREGLIVTLIVVAPFGALGVMVVVWSALAAALGSC